MGKRIFIIYFMKSYYLQSFLKKDFLTKIAKGKLYLSPHKSRMWNARFNKYLEPSTWVKIIFKNFLLSILYLNKY